MKAFTITIGDRTHLIEIVGNETQMDGKVPLAPNQFRLDTAARMIFGIVTDLERKNADS